MPIKKFSLRGLDYTANTQVLTTDNLNSAVVLSAITAIPQLRGATGPQGNVGLTGATGIQGNIGLTGSTGATGAAGTPGTAGATGATGTAGTPGTAGATGVQGDNGSTGATGIQGNVGPTGPTGATGIAGNVGATGLTGATGTFVGFTVRSLYSSNFQPITTVSNVTSMEFDDDSGFTVTNRGSGNVLVAMQSTFKYWHVTGSANLTATGLDHITINSGNNIVITSNAGAQPYQSITFSTVSDPTFANVTASAIYANAFYTANGTPFTSGATISSTAPATPAQGQLWLNADTGELYVYYYDGDSFQWIQPVGSGGSSGSGTAGATGATGPAGTSGNTGATGSPGAAGTQGATGPQGNIGLTGATGAQGIQGNVGADGATGATGVQGIQGNVGATGLTGATGIQGNVGATGLTGATGPVYTISVSDTAPVSPTSGNLWWDSSVGSLFFYYVDADSSQWVSAAVAPSGSGGGTSLGSRTVANVSTGSIAANITANVSAVGFKGYNLYKIYSSHPAWVRLYTSNSARTTDSVRSQGTDPTPDVGIITEVITSNIAQTVVLAPAVTGFNDETTPTTSIPMAITNLSGAANTIVVSLTLVQTEA